MRTRRHHIGIPFSNRILLILYQQLDTPIDPVSVIAPFKMGNSLSPAIDLALFSICGTSDQMKFQQIEMVALINPTQILAYFPI
jgi:hypothetical protein